MDMRALRQISGQKLEIHRLVFDCVQYLCFAICMFCLFWFAISVFSVVFLCYFPPVG